MGLWVGRGGAFHMDLLAEMDRDLVVCECGHIESFHDDSKERWCLALNCAKCNVMAPEEIRRN